MEQQNTNAGIPKGLNILTILTFIGCSVFGILILCSPMINKFFLGMISKAETSGKEFTAKELESMQKGKEALELANHNMIPNIIVGMVGILLCFVGAMWMRKLKKDGFWMYTAGQVIPIIGSVLIMGLSQFESITTIIIGLAIPALFVFLYARQRKHLVN